MRLTDVVPRWKSCLVLFTVLTVATVFLPSTVGWILFVLATSGVILRGYRNPDIPCWVDMIRVVLLSALLGTLAGSAAHNLHRSGLIRVSRDVHITHPEWFLCCIWSGRQEKWSPSYTPP